MRILPDKNETHDTEFGEFALLQGDEILSKHPMVDFFLSFWKENGGPECCISREHIKPVELKQYLDRLVLIDLVKTEDGFTLPVRLIGSRVASFYGEITGQDIKAINNKKAVVRIYTACEKVIENQKPVLTITPAFAPDKTYLQATALYCPLFDKDKQINKIFVAVDVERLKRLAP